MTGSTQAERKAKATSTASKAAPAEIKDKLYSSFANVAALMGYSEVHGRIIAALTADGGPVSLGDLAKETGYSLSSISTSLDLLEVLGMVRKVKVAGDRRVFVQLDGDLLEGMKRAIVMKGQKGVENAFKEFTKYEAALATMPESDDRAKIANVLATLRSELERLQAYLELLGAIQLPREPPVRR
ncbi:MAG TPA: MarR family transcriptional regulator [Candidatus Thermoplasmatota archaeon]|jgi:DNA-binding transcriptional regulator GbsR (MarR family)|nr:MarR family transcriptional regulator [Candidatus Thermoplasmatota archaeon]